MAEKPKEDVSVQLINQKVQFKGMATAHPDLSITIDYVPPIGDGQGYTGLELFLLSLCGCSATAVVHLLRKMGKAVSGLEVKARGLKREKPPIQFEKIFLEFIVQSKDAQETDVQKVILLAEESLCPVWQMIKNNVEVVSSYTILK